MNCVVASCKGGVEITPLKFVVKYNSSELLADTARRVLLASFLWQQNTVNVWQDTTSSDRDPTQELAQLLVVTHSQLDVTGHNPGLLVVASSIASQL